MTYLQTPKYMKGLFQLKIDYYKEIRNSEFRGQQEVKCFAIIECNMNSGKNNSYYIIISNLDSETSEFKKLVLQELATINIKMNQLMDQVKTLVQIARSQN
ncbi:hypothetical protein HHI36_004824 [Cryptolaemus montrouzieri]|uniref:Uncharacterized protein n=1 Tax=Cryptolaemus montrouzieri TaxID=559131 RepID=A0ABD2NSR2_9CUCU